MFNDCFTAKCAVDFLYEILKKNENFEVEVTRQQVVKANSSFVFSRLFRNCALFLKYVGCSCF